jgi:hypothetical protein
MAFECKCGKEFVEDGRVDKFEGGRALVTSVGVSFGFGMPAEKVDAR